MNIQEDIQSIKRYVVRLEEQGKTEFEILESIYKWGTQAVIVELLNIRRLKYLSEKVCIVESLVVVQIVEKNNHYQILTLFVKRVNREITVFVMLAKGIITAQSYS
ncbi:hypothetical protein [Bacillus cereus]|uniref:hypothetical protein n=1 Tax=Bacillus cereus TaxID=1396 RepID=UPI001CD1FC75|nr:hypothetical protein [Bacillus cereus]